MSPKHDTREAWLEAAAAELEAAIFVPNDVEIPLFRVSVGSPNGRAKKTTFTMGECFPTSASEAGVNEVFISPTANDPVELLQILGHEMIHVHDDCASGHRGEFARVHKLVGYVGKKTTHDIGEELHETYKEIAETLGEYPHAKMHRSSKRTSEGKKGSRNLKVQCPNEGYTIRTTRKWLDELGAPFCPCGSQMEEL